MGEQWQRDPKSGDYVVAGGAPAKTSPSDLKVPAYIRLRCPREGWLYAKSRDFGSRLGEVKKNGTAAPHDAQLVETLAQQALQPIVDDGRAIDVVAKVTEQGRPQGIGFVAVLTAQSGEPQVLELPAVR